MIWKWLPVGPRERRLITAFARKPGPAKIALPPWPRNPRGRAATAPMIAVPDSAKVPPAPSGAIASPAASGMANCATRMAVIRIDNAVPRARGGEIAMVSATELVSVIPRPNPVAAMAIAIAQTGNGSTNVSSATPPRPADSRVSLIRPNRLTA
jgi:hypothetical protein